jgi:hypothetical protein
VSSSEDPDQKAVGFLNALLYEELFAAATQREARHWVADEAAAQTLEACARSHARRASLLRREIRLRGGVAEWWGRCDEFAEPLGRASGSKTFVLACIVDAEEARQRRYELELDDLDARTRAFVEKNVLGEQARNCELLGQLRRRATPPTSSAVSIGEPPAVTGVIKRPA